MNTPSPAARSINLRHIALPLVTSLILAAGAAAGWALWTDHANTDTLTVQHTTVGFAARQDNQKSVATSADSVVSLTLAGTDLITQLATAQENAIAIPIEITAATSGEYGMSYTATLAMTTATALDKIAQTALFQVNTPDQCTPETWTATSVTDLSTSDQDQVAVPPPDTPQAFHTTTINLCLYVRASFDTYTNEATATGEHSLNGGETATATDDWSTQLIPIADPTETLTITFSHTLTKN